MRLARALVHTAVILLLAACGAAAQAADKLIVPGERIGPWSLAMTVDDLVRVIGPKQAIGNPEGQLEFLPNQQDLVRPLWIHRWDQVRLRALTVERSDQQIVGLTVLDDGYKTAAGIGIGATREQVIAAHGAPTAETAPNQNQRHLVYDALGMTLRVTHNVAPEEQKVVLINVFRAGTARERWRH